MDLPRFGGRLRAWVRISDPVACCPPVARYSLFGPRRSHSSVPARTKVRPSRAAAVKRGPRGPPEGLVFDGREHDGRLVCDQVWRLAATVYCCADELASAHAG